MELLLWILAVILVVSGIVSIVRGSILWGVRADRRRPAGGPGRGQHLQLTRGAAGGPDIDTGGIAGPVCKRLLPPARRPRPMTETTASVVAGAW